MSKSDIIFDVDEADTVIKLSEEVQLKGSTWVAGQLLKHIN